MKKEAMLSSSTFSVEREGRDGMVQQTQRSVEERQRFEKSADTVEQGSRYDKADEIRKILEKIAMERLRESEGWRKMDISGEEEGGSSGRGGTRDLDLCSSRKQEREQIAGGRGRHSSGKSIDQLQSKRSQGQDIFSTEELLRELSRAADCSSSESSKSDRGRRRIPMSRQHSSTKLASGMQEYPAGYRQEVQFNTMPTGQTSSYQRASQHSSYPLSSLATPSYSTSSSSHLLPLHQPSAPPYLASQDPACNCPCQECLDLHYSPSSYTRSPSDQDQLRQGIVPMETPFIMDNVLDDGMAACVVM